MWRFGVIFVLLLATISAAQDETWYAWLYDAGTGGLTLIDGRGFIREQAQLPLTRNMSLYPYNVAVSASGTRFAYVLSDSSRSELIVYDPRPARREIVLQYALPPLNAETLTLSSSVGQLFAPDETRLAFGYSRKEGGWELVLIDTQTDQATLILRGGAGAAADLSTEAGITPVIRAFDGVSVVFTLVQPAALSQTATFWQSYVWNVQANSVQPASAYLSLDSDVFAPTGEIVEASSEGGSQIFLYTSTTSSGGLGLATSESRLFFPRFVQNGQAVLYAELDAQGKIAYRVIRRGSSGDILEAWEAGRTQIISSVRGTATGFAYTVDTIKADDTNGTTLYHLDTAAGLSEGRPLFIAPTNTHPRLVWLHDPRLTTAPPWTEALSPVPTQEAIYTQEDTWQAWVYQDSGTAVRVDYAGQALDIETIPPEAVLETFAGREILRPTRLTASEDGDWLVYVVGVEAALVVQVYDTRQNRVLMTYRIEGTEGTRLPHTLDRAPHNLLNETRTALAFGYGKAAGWQIDVLDVGSGEVLTNLAPESPAMRRLITDVAFGVVPVIQTFAEGKVHFTIQAAGALTPPYPAFVWDTITDTVNPTLLYANPMTDTFFPTGEVIMAMIDPRLPNTADRFLYGQLNALHVYDPTSGTRTPFYNAPELWLQKPLFIQNGERIVSGGVDAAGAFVGWSVLERDGEVMSVLPLPDNIIDAAGTGSGLVYIPRDETGGTLTLYYVNTRQALDAGQAVWSIPRTGRPQIVWTLYPTQPVTHRPWRALDVPIEVSPAATAEPPSRGTDLVIGGAATVRTTNGDALYVRAAPGTEADVLTRLNSGTRVTLVDGPTELYGQSWWLIRTPGGVAGWVVEEAQGVKTLTPEED